MFKYWYFILTNIAYFKAQRLHYKLLDILLDKKPRRLRKNYIQYIAKYYSKNSRLPIKYFVNQLKKKGFS